MSHTTPSRPSDRLAISGSDECSSPSVCRLFSVPSSRLCVPVQSLATYAEVNKDLLLPEKAVRFPEQFQVNAKYENIVHGTVVVGGKSTVGPGCFIGEGSHVGEKVSIKRSVIGTSIVVSFMEREFESNFEGGKCRELCLLNLSIRLSYFFLPGLQAHTVASGITSRSRTR